MEWHVLTPRDKQRKNAKRAMEVVLLRRLDNGVREYEVRIGDEVHIRRVEPEEGDDA